jgi:hypothetical protein
MIAAFGARVAKASYLNTLNKLDTVKNSTTTIPKATTAISGIHLGTMIFQARKLGAERWIVTSSNSLAAEYIITV